MPDFLHFGGVRLPDKFAKCFKILFGEICPLDVEFVEKLVFELFGIATCQGGVQVEVVEESLAFGGHIVGVAVKSMFLMAYEEGWFDVGVAVGSGEVLE